jgi:ATP-dependent Lon protease
MIDPICVLPTVALRGTTILPGMILHFDVSRERSIKAVEAAMLQDQKIYLVTQKDSNVEIPGILDLYQVGTIAYIKQVIKLPQNLLRVLVEGTERAELLSFSQEYPYLKADVACYEDQEEESYPAAVKDAMEYPGNVPSLLCREWQDK